MGLKRPHSQQFLLHSLLHPRVLHVSSCQKHVADQRLLLLRSVSACGRDVAASALGSSCLRYRNIKNRQQVHVGGDSTLYHYLARTYCSVSISPIWSSPVNEGWKRISGHRSRSVPINSWWYSAMLNTGCKTKSFLTPHHQGITMYTDHFHQLEDDNLKVSQQFPNSSC